MSNPTQVSPMDRDDCILLFSSWVASTQRGQAAAKVIRQRGSKWDVSSVLSTVANPLRPTVLKDRNLLIIIIVKQGQGAS